MRIEHLVLILLGAVYVTLWWFVGHVEARLDAIERDARAARVHAARADDAATRTLVHLRPDLAEAHGDPLVADVVTETELDRWLRTRD